jgi:hypothetical protein
MTKEKKSKKEDLTDLHRILDDLSLEEIDNNEKEFLISLARRIEENYGPIYKPSKEKKQPKEERKSFVLEPKVKVHHTDKTVYTKKRVNSSKEKRVKSQDLIEIEKVDSAPPEFTEIKPKTKEEKTDLEIETIKKTEEEPESKDELKEWEPVKVEEEKSDKATSFYCPHCGSKLEGEYKFCPVCGKKTFLEELDEDIEKEEEWEKVESEEEKNKVEEKLQEDKENKKKTSEKKVTMEEKENIEETKKKPEKKVETKKQKDVKDKKIEKNKKPSVEKKEEISKVETKKDSKKEKDEDVFDKPWNNAFIDLESVDDKIGELLYNNGITSLKILKDTNVKDLKKIHGIRGRLAKKIKSEVRDLEEELEDSFDKKETLKDESDEWVTVETDGYQVDDYTLYEKKVEGKDGKKRTVRFFSKKEPAEGEPIDLPKGYEVKRNKRTNVPYLKKK